MSQSLADILIHLVFSTKDRMPLIQPEIEPALHAYMATVLREFGSPPVIIGGTENHVHLLLGLSKTSSVAEVVEKVKKTSSKWIKTQGHGLDKFYWQAGYGAFSIGQSNKAALVKYIAGQKEHHRRRSFQDEFRAILLKYGVSWDERYVWD